MHDSIDTAARIKGWQAEAKAREREMNKPSLIRRILGIRMYLVIHLFINTPAGGLKRLTWRGLK